MSGISTGLRKALAMPYRGGGSRFPQMLLAPKQERHMKLRRPTIRQSDFDPSSYVFAEKDISAGYIVEIRSAKKELLGHGFFEPQRECVDVFDYFSVTESLQLPQVDVGFWEHRLESALRLRQQLIGRAEESGTDCFRMVHGAADGIPGLYVDVFGKWASLTCRTEGSMTVLPTARLFLRKLGFQSGFFYDTVKHGGGVEVRPQSNSSFSENHISYRYSLGVESAKAIDDMKMIRIPLRAARRFVQSLSYDKKVLEVGGVQGGTAAAALSGKAKRVVSVCGPEDEEGHAETIVTNFGTRNHIRIVANPCLPEAFAGSVAQGSDVVVVEGGKGQSVSFFREVLSHVLPCVSRGGVLILLSCDDSLNPSVLGSLVASATWQYQQEHKVDRSFGVVRIMEDAVDYPQAIDKDLLSVQRPMCGVVCVDQSGRYS